jgi:hypothetical protein
VSAGACPACQGEGHILDTIDSDLNHRCPVCSGTREWGDENDKALLMALLNGASRVETQGDEPSYFEGHHAKSKGDEWKLTALLVVDYEKSSGGAASMEYERVLWLKLTGGE